MYTQQAVLQPQQQQPEVTDLVDTECHSIASTEATHLDRIAAYMKDVDTYSKGTPDGDADNSMMEDPPVPGCDDLQSVTDDKGVGVGLNRAGSMLLSQSCDAMELESIAPGPDSDYIALHSETSHLLDNSLPFPKTNLKMSRTKAPGIKPAGEGARSMAKIEIKGSLLKPQHAGGDRSKPKRENTAGGKHRQVNRTYKEDIEPSREDAVGRSSQYLLDQESFVDVSLNSSSGCVRQDGGHTYAASQDYVSNLSLPYNQPVPNVHNSLSRVGPARPVNSSASVDYNRRVNQLASDDDRLGHLDSQQYTRKMHRAPSPPPPPPPSHGTGQTPGAVCHRDTHPDGRGDYSDSRVKTALRTRAVNPHDFDLTSQGSCYKCNSSHRYHVHANPVCNQLSLLQEDCHHQPQPGNKVAPLGSYSEGNSSTPCCHGTAGYHETRDYHPTPGWYGAGLPQSDVVECFGGHYPQSVHDKFPETFDPRGCTMGPPGGCHQGGNHQCYCNQNQPSWGAGPMHCALAHCRYNGHMTSHNGHLMSHNGHMTYRGHVMPQHNFTPITGISNLERQHQHNAINRNQLWSHQATMTTQHPCNPLADTPMAIRHQSEIATPPGSSHPVQQLQQAEDLGHVTVVIPMSPKYPYPTAPPARPAIQFPPPRTAQVDNADGYVGVAALSSANADRCAVPNSLTDCGTASNYITLPSSGHEGTASCVRQDVGPISSGVYTNSERTRCLHEAEEISFARNLVSTANKQPCIPSLLN